MAVLKIEDLTMEYERGGYTVRAIDSLSFEAEEGELVLLLGPSGCGKTTLLSCLAGILTPTRGSIELRGTEVTTLAGAALDGYRRRTVGIVFQAFNLIPSLSALENVVVPLRLSGVSMGEARERARALLETVGMGERALHLPSDLSGGQQQRVAIARGLALDPPLILADEPTAHLDYIQVEGLLHLIRTLATPPKVLVVATHDDRMVPLADRVVELAPRFGAPSRPPEEFSFARGEVVFDQGERGELVYFVEEGTVEIVRVRSDGSEEPLALIEPGEYFGELGPLLGFPRTATARAATDLRLTGYTLHDFKQRAAKDPAASSLLGAAERASEAAADSGAPHAKRGTDGTKSAPRKAKARPKVKPRPKPKAATPSRRKP